MNELPRARRRVDVQPAWAARLADAQARANARRVARSDATITTWVYAMMREAHRAGSLRSTRRAR
jgi:hypothetical protein